MRGTLEALEGNPAVSTVILGGDTAARVFSAGSSYVELQAAAASGDAATRAAASAALREQYRLHHCIATYTKPLVSTIVGPALGSGWALAAHCDYVYGTRASSVAFPDVAAGLVPHGGASYYLSRLDGGLGMYLALTGAAIRGA